MYELYEIAEQPSILPLKVFRTPISEPHHSRGDASKRCRIMYNRTRQLAPTAYERATTLYDAYPIISSYLSTVQHLLTFAVFNFFALSLDILTSLAVFRHLFGNYKWIQDTLIAADSAASSMRLLYGVNLGPNSTRPVSP